MLATSLPSLRPAPAPARHPCEWTLLVLVAAYLGFLPWAFGGVDPWSQIAGACLAFAALFTALLPRSYPASAQSGRPFRMRPGQRLLTFPVFWLGLLVLIYVLLQALNPAYNYHLSGTQWWLAPRAHVNWLPTGMATPFAESNPWRVLLVWSSHWACVCALWTGLTQRSSILLLLRLLCVNALVFAAFGILQKAAGATEIYGIRAVGFPYFVAALIYKNHAAAYFSLLASVTIGLAIHHRRRRLNRPNEANPTVLYVLFSLTLILALLITFSFSGTLLFGGVLLCLIPSAWRWQANHPFLRRTAPVLGAFALLGVMGALTTTVSRGEVAGKVRGFFSGDGYHSGRTRLLAAGQGAAMFGDRWGFGWGAGSFRYGFSKYQRTEPELLRWRHLSLRWEHVHNDWLELLIELGVVGTLPIIALLLYWMREVGRTKLWRQPALFPMLAGLGALALHGFVDFPFQNPAVAATACALAPLLIRWSELDPKA